MKNKEECSLCNHLKEDCRCSKKEELRPFLIPVKDGRNIIVDSSMSHLANWKWYICNMGYPVRSYLNDKGEYSKIFLHHAVIGRPINKKMKIDHINGNRLDNRLENLRFVTVRENGNNRKEHRGEKIKESNYVGVTRNYKNWRSKIEINGKEITLGTFSNQKDAYSAYLGAKKIVVEVDRLKKENEGWEKQLRPILDRNVSLSVENGIQRAEIERLKENIKKKDEAFEKISAIKEPQYNGQRVLSISSDAMYYQVIAKEALKLGEGE